MNERLLTLTIGLFLLSACQAMTGISHRYPESWPELIRTASSQCTDISGTYVEKGVCNYPLHCNSLSLFNRLASTEAQPIDQSTVTVKQLSPDQIEVSLSNKDGMATKQLSSKSEDFVCEDGAVWIKQGEDFHAEGVGVASRKYIMGFKKASDGSLIGQHRNTGWGLVMWVVPIGGTQILWYKWSTSN